MVHILCVYRNRGRMEVRDRERNWHVPILSIFGDLVFMCVWGGLAWHYLELQSLSF